MASFGVLKGGGYENFSTDDLAIDDHAFLVHYDRPYPLYIDGHYRHILQ